MSAPTDWGDVALSCTRDQFVAVYRHPFLYSTQKLVKPPRPQATGKIDINTQLVPLVAILPPTEINTPPVVIAVTKVQKSFPSMITIGRTANNDVVIDDVQMSRFHAFFRLTGEQWELADAGSLNGTRLKGKELEKKGGPKPVNPGDLINFGSLEFVFVTNAAAWDRLIEDSDNWGD